MNRLIAVLAAALWVCAGCGGDTYESLAAEGVTTMGQFANALDTIKDEASAKAARPELKNILAKMKSIQERQDKLGTPTEAQVKAVVDKYGKQMEEVQTKLATNMMRIGFDPKIQKELADLEGDMKTSLK